MTRPGPFHRRCDTVQYGRNIPSSHKNVLLDSLNCRYGNILSLCRRKTRGVAKPETPVWPVAVMDVSGSQDSVIHMQCVNIHGAHRVGCASWGQSGRAWCNEYASAWVDWRRVKCHTNDLNWCGGADSQHAARQSCVPCQERKDARKVAYLAEIRL